MLRIKFKGIVMLHSIILLVPLFVKSQYGNSSLASKARSSVLMTAADSIWNNLPLAPTGSFRDGREASSKLFESLEKYHLLFREKGLKFWYKFPEDNRRYTWFLKTLNCQPKYWLNIRQGAEFAAAEMYQVEVAPPNLNEYKIQQWDSVYPILRRDFLSSSFVNDSLKREFRKSELVAFLNHPLARQRKIDIDSLNELFSVSCKEVLTTSYKPNFYTPQNPLDIINLVYDNHESYGLTYEDLIGFTSRYLNSSNVLLRKWAEAKMAIYTLKIENIQFKAESIEGKMINLKDYKGKVVLLDFWATTCSSCIAKMRQLKPIHEKYRKRGFEILSISINAKNEIEKVLEVEKYIGSSWPIVIIGGETNRDWNISEGKRIFTQFGFRAVPQLILLDKKGIMREYNGILRNGNIEPIVEKLLVEN